MILFDTSVILDARDASSPWHVWAKGQIKRATPDGAVNTVVIAETSVRAVRPGSVPKDLMDLGLTLVPLPVSAATPAGVAYAVYLDRLKREGMTALSRMPLPDFLIGAHALAEGCALVTRDPDRVKTYFPAVTLITP